MIIRIYRSLKKTPAGIEIIDTYQWPIHFIEQQPDIDINADRYYDILLETEGELIQIVPKFNTKDFNYLREIKMELDRKITVLENKLLTTANTSKIVEYKLACINYYCKLVDLFPTLDIIEKVSHTIEFFIKDYSTLDGLSEFKNYWDIFSPILSEKLNTNAERIKGLLVLDNYNRLNLNDYPSEFPEGYVINNRQGFSKFMTKFSNKSMSLPPPRIIKNYGLVQSLIPHSLFCTILSLSTSAKVCVGLSER